MSRKMFSVMYARARGVNGLQSACEHRDQQCNPSWLLLCGVDEVTKPCFSRSSKIQMTTLIISETDALFGHLDAEITSSTGICYIGGVCLLYGAVFLVQTNGA